VSDPSTDQNRSDPGDPPPVAKSAKINWSLVKSIFFGVGGVCAASGVLFVAVNWIQSKIDSAVERKLSDPKILRQIAAEARPTVIFNANESVVADLGGAQFIKNISIKREDKDERIPREIDIDFTAHLPNAPLLTPLHNDSVTISARRGKGFSWHFTLDYGMTLGLAEGEERTYRLELIR